MPELAETLRIAEDLHKANLHTLEDVKVTSLGKEWLVKKGFSPYWFEYIQYMPLEWHAFGKQIVMFSPEANEMKYLRLSLGMTGRFKLDAYLNETDKRHILFTMNFKEGTVHYVDYRKFFQIGYITPGYMVFSNFSLLKLVNGEVSVNQNVHISAPTRKPKVIEVLDEGKYTGIGNYLANEGFGRSGVDPRTPFKDFSEKKYVMTTIQGVALESYAAGGHSFNGGFIRPNGETGHFRPQVYGNSSKYNRLTFRGRPVWVEKEVLISAL